MSKNDVARPEGGFLCPGRADWNYVGPHTLRAGGKPWPCVWAHPATGQDLVIDLGEQLLGENLVLEAALAYSAAQGGASVELEVSVGEEKRTLVRTPAPRRPGTTRARVGTRSRQTPPRIREARGRGSALRR